MKYIQVPAGGSWGARSVCLSMIIGFVLYFLLHLVFILAIQILSLPAIEVTQSGIMIKISKQNVFNFPWEVVRKVGYLFIEGLDGKSVFLVVSLDPRVKLDYKPTVWEKFIALGDNKVIINGVLKDPARNRWLQNTVYYQQVKDSPLVMVTIGDISRKDAMELVEYIRMYTNVFRIPMNMGVRDTSGDGAQDGDTSEEASSTS